MKYKLETIPVWDALKEKSECPFCLLTDKAHERYIQYYLGNSAMNPETRVEVNKTGFCPDHFSRLLLARSPQHLGLITHTHLQTLTDKLEKDFPGTEKGRMNRLFKKGSSPAQTFSETMRQQTANCLICDRVAKTLKRYTFTTVYLWQNREEGFREELESSKGFCLPHMTALLEMADEMLSSSEGSEFFARVKEIQMKNLKRLEEEILWFTQKFKAENFDKPWGDSQDAHYRLVQKLTGKKTPH